MNRKPLDRSAWRDLICCATALAALLFAAPAARAALITITSLDGDGADHYVTEGSPTSTPTRDHRLFVRTSSTNGHQVTYIRFDLSSVTDPVQDVTIALAQITTAAFTLNLYGLNDHSSETSLWLEDTITYNTAPGMGVPDGNNATSDLDLSKVTSLGSFSMGSFTSPPALTRSMNAAAITTFLQNDTNGLATFVLETTSSGTNQFRSSRDRSTGDAFLAGEHPPRIVITTVPEPGTYVLAVIGLFGLGVIRLRKRSSAGFSFHLFFAREVVIMHKQPFHHSIRTAPIRFVAALALVLAASLLEREAAAVTILSSDGSGADHYVNEANLSTSPNRDHRLFLRRGSTDHLVTYIRFDVSSIADPISDATIELSLITTGSSVVTLYGLNDDASETTLWDPNTINYNTAPGMGLSDSSLSTSDLDLSKVTSLGNYTMDQIATSGVPETRTMNSVAIKDFLNADSNGLVTFIIERQSGSATIQFRSSRPRSTDPAWLPTEHAPRLVLSTFVPLAGDFDSDGDVDGADFIAWQTNFPTLENATLAQGDADDDGDVDGADFHAWQASFPNPSAGVSPVPEPAAGMLILAGLATVAGIGRLRGRRGR